MAEKPEFPFNWFVGRDLDASQEGAGDIPDAPCDRGLVDCASRYDDGEEIDRLKAENADWRRVIDRDNNFLWGLLYPSNPTGWEYRTQPHAHIKVEIDRLRAENARLRFAVLYAFGWACAEKGAK